MTEERDILKKATDTGPRESFNGRLRDECLNVHEFVSIDQARQRIEAWRVDYNGNRLHGALGHLTPSEYARSGRKTDVEGAPLLFRTICQRSQRHVHSGIAMSQHSVTWHFDPRGVATITLNRPEAGNSYDAAMLGGLMTAMDELGAQSGLRVVLITGAGQHFLAGADLGWLQSVARQSPGDNLDASRLTAGVMHRLNRLKVPTVALIQGECRGGANGIVAACDVAIAADNAQFSIAETRWGLMPGIIIPQLADAIGVRQIRRYALTGERFDAHEAHRIGLVHDVVAAGSLAEAGARIVDHLLRNAPKANAQTKALALEHAWSNVPHSVFERLVAQHAARRQSAEAAEGFASFREKRPAIWYPGPASENE